jgi:hypothetical protein
MAARVAYDLFGNKTPADDGEFPVNPAGSATIPPTALPLDPGQIATGSIDPSLKSNAGSPAPPQPLATPDPMTQLATADQYPSTPSYVNLSDPIDAAIWKAYQAKGIMPGGPSGPEGDFNAWRNYINASGGATPSNLAYWAGHMAQDQGGVGDYLERPEVGGSNGGGSIFGSVDMNGNPIALADPANDPFMADLSGIASTGQTPDGADLMATLKSIIGAGGSLNPARLTARLSAARSSENTAMQGMLSDARNALAANGTLSEPGTPQGTLADAVQRITDRIAPTFAAETSNIYSNESQQSDARLMNALSLATGMSSDQSAKMLQAVGVGTQRQSALATIALNSLQNNQQWNEFLANYGLNREALLAQIQSGKIASLVPLLQLFMQGAQTSANGFI